MCKRDKSRSSLTNGNTWRLSSSCSPTGPCRSLKESMGLPGKECEKDSVTYNSTPYNSTMMAQRKISSSKNSIVISQKKKSWIRSYLYLLLAEGSWIISFFLLFFPVLLKYNWPIALYKLKIHSIIICSMYIIKWLLQV